MGLKIWTPLLFAVLICSMVQGRPTDEDELKGDGSHHVPAIQFDNADVVPPGESPLKNLDKIQGNREYVDFINELYRFDTTKTALKFDENRSVNNKKVTLDLSPEYNPEYNAEVNSNSRRKRALVFRPLFVYRQQEVKRQKVTTPKPAPKKDTIPANQSQLYKDKNSKVYKEHNSFYDPYRYGQRFPYRQY